MKESKNDLSVIQYTHGFNYGFEYTDGICPTITISSWQHNNFIKYMADQNAIKLPSELKGKKFRIRKLTPRECFRLMGVDDSDIDKIQAFPYESLIEHPAYSKAERFAGITEKEKRAAMKRSISDSAQYKLAGNSIVVDVLYHLFRKMFVDTENENPQMELF